ncbi:MAG: GNAT family N-acetyltransferase [Acidobacteriia bacterium]|nr:GNAT family N-acetyltransferase [Terriglobia bacterium]
MSSDVAMRPARREDAPAIVELFHAGFSPSLVDATIYGCPGVARYVAQQIGVAGGRSDTVFTVAETDGRLAACVELRRRASDVFLNYIAVAGEARGRGVGTAVLRAAIEGWSVGGRCTFSLDVFEENSSAASWYERLGLRDVQRSSLWNVPLRGDEGTAEGWTVSGWPQAEASQREFGFSAFDAVGPDARYTVGRLGSRWFRLTEATALGRDGLRALLRELDPGRRVLAIATGGDDAVATIAGAALLVRSRRMSAELGTVLERLG